MKDVITANCGDNNVAFAHSISADLKMSAGVAKVFKHKFGAPAKGECVTANLAFQKDNSSIGIYSLITKPYFFSKPSEDNYNNYNTAFQNLKEDFKTRKYKKLICSPMGCVRDGVPVKHFMTNLINFQEDTGAEIEIITYNENPFGNLKNDLPHSVFLNTIKKSILELKSKKNSFTIPKDRESESFALFSLEDFPPFPASMIGVSDAMSDKVVSHTPTPQQPQTEGAESTSAVGSPFMGFTTPEVILATRKITSEDSNSNCRTYKTTTEPNTPSSLTGELQYSSIQSCSTPQRSVSSVGGDSGKQSKGDGESEKNESFLMDVQLPASTT